jgi:hypothetical protein
MMISILGDLEPGGLQGVRMTVLRRVRRIAVMLQRRFPLNPFVGWLRGIGVAYPLRVSAVHELGPLDRTITRVHAVQPDTSGPR